jgi:hypothetical protein
MLRTKLEESQLFARLPGLAVDDVVAVGGVVVSKAVLMPIRLLYVLLPEHVDALVASPEQAVVACSRHYGEHSWWPLVQLALEWRHSSATSTERAERTARCMRGELVPLYRSLLQAYATAMAEQGEATVRRGLVQWLDRLGG